VVLTALSALTAVACIVASLRRLERAVAPTSLCPALVRRALSACDDARAMAPLRVAIAGVDGPSWEGELLAAFSLRDASLREAAVSECLIELESLARRWDRVPQICTRISSSSGFFFACISLVGAAGRMTFEGAAEASLHAVGALDSFAVGLAGASFSFAAAIQSRRALRRWMSEMNALVERLRALASTQDALAAEGPGR
jgi:hypothetical protein